MKWLRRKLRSWLKIEYYVGKEIERQCEVLSKSVRRGNYPWDEESRSIAIELTGLIKKHVIDHSDNKISDTINEVISELAINKEKFLDEIVARLKAKQV